MEVAVYPVVGEVSRSATMPAIALAALTPFFAAESSEWFFSLRSSLT